MLLVVLGPTASGKTALSLHLAAAFKGEIVNCDSVAMIRELSIGTAKPTAEERACAPHHLFDIVDPTAYTTAGEYARTARTLIQEIRRRGTLPIVVGGTGLYLRALLDGLSPGPLRSEQLRERLRRGSRKKGPGYLHRLLARLDRKSAQAIHVNDIPKVIRAIEVCLTARRPMSEQWQAGRDPLRGFRILRLGLNPAREELYERIHRRGREMFERGLVEETGQLLAKYGEAARALNSLGYRQAVKLIQGRIDRESAVRAVEQAHRNYAKRQMTWFRREAGVIWMSGFGDDPAIQAQAGALVESNLRELT
ncbi:MAG: tRNA (adenosine(37)-N6)-dimethylallyltransferase MiaA [Acidobacteria bacterium]|nr:tRNA (adenosine(37)-N6)-dimethylallyltransferase MiaA [Acidobacteriota bacterium]